MTLTKRIMKILGALLTALGAWIILKLGEQGFLFVGLVLSVSLIVFGVRNLIFYFTMARHMVNGRSILYLGVIALDFGVFTLSVSRYQGLFVVLYILVAHAFSGAIDIMRAREARQMEAGFWRLNMAEGVINISFALAAIVFGLVLDSVKVVSGVYAAGLIYTAVMNLISAFRKTAIVYIQ